MKQKFIVTATPPTTNGDLHLGHMSGPYLGADIFTRAQRLMGHDVVYMSSTDDNQSYLLSKAVQEKRTPREVVADYSAKIRKSLQATNIQMDAFTSPDHPVHIQRVQGYFTDLHSQGLLIEKELDFLYCEHCEQVLYEAFVKGKCPSCSAGCGGNFCEECGYPNDPLDMIDPYCLFCDTTPVIKRQRIVVFPLEPMRQKLEGYYRSHSYQWKPRLKEWYSNFLARPLPEIPVSNICEWGVPVPLDGFENQVINVWFEMMPGHLATMERWNEEQSDQDFWNWSKQKGTRLVQFFGFDNSFYYAVLHTAMMLGVGQHITADAFVVNEFYLLEHKKFSTSRKHAIWASEFITTSNSDLVRMYLSMTGPEQKQTNFSLSEFDRTGETFFSELIIPFIQGSSPEAQIQEDSIYEVVEKFKSLFEKYYSTEFFSPSSAVYALRSFVMQAVDTKETNNASALLALALFAYPVMPIFGSELWTALTGKSEGQMSWDTLEFNDAIQLDNGLTYLQECLRSEVSV